MTIRVHESELVTEEWPPPPFIYWSSDAIKAFLRNRGFDFNQPVVMIQDHTGKRWEQDKE